MKHLSRSGRRALLAGAAATGTLLPVVVTGAGSTAAGADPLPSLSIAATPGLYPAFSPAVSDYTVRCNSAPVQVTVTVPAGQEVEVDGTGDHFATFTQTVPLTADASFSVTDIDLSGAGSSASYYVRCLPSDFPDFQIASPTLHPQAQYYMALAVPASLLASTAPATQYMTLFDDDGVPVWWRSINDKSIDATLLGNGDAAEISVMHKTAEEYSLAGPTTRLIAPRDGQGVDLHEVQLLPNGNYLIASNTVVPGQDLSFMGGPSSGPVIDPVVKEITPDGTVVWSWDALAHIPVDEAPQQWWSTDLNSQFSGPNGYDIYHFNSAAEQNGTVLVSFRQLNAVYLIDKASGNIIWKLGGTSDSKSLQVLNDPDATQPLGGQHDARFAPDGTITVHDDRTFMGAPRAVSYRIDAGTMTATLAQEVTDPLVSSAFCCGSARLLPGGDWVLGWGFNNLITEVNPAAPPSQFRQFLVEWSDPGLFNYRVEPVMPGQLSPVQLRADMDAYAASGG